jgi:uncharacterized protein (TIGR02594 family)
MIFSSGLEDRVKKLEDEFLAIKQVIADQWVTKEILSPQMLIFNTAKKELGVKEIPGKDHNKRILEYLETCGINAGDETPWCSAFVNWCVEQSKMKGTDSATARSWMSWGKESSGKKGDIVVFWREKIDGWKGHVGFVNSIEADGSIYVLGGNQADSVSIAKYSRDRLLGFREVTDKQFSET